MAKFLVQKSAPLSGEVKISGSKNAVLPIMAATLLTDEPCVIKDVPALRDVEVMCRLLENLGATVNENLDDNRVDITASGEIRYEAPYDLSLIHICDAMLASIEVSAAPYSSSWSCLSTRCQASRERSSPCWNVQRHTSRKLLLSSWCATVLYSSCRHSTGISR